MKLLHAGLVAEDRALGAFARGVDCEHGKLTAVLEYVQAEYVDTRTLACAGNAGNAYAA